ncbi:phage tail assembly chaperone [Ralstonia sp. L16]|uniref:phage tail assembly chaperone n=1 Tax=Ralstonia sp. L16 TaxID=3423950 RepID=UPI003F78B920
MAALIKQYSEAARSNVLAQQAREERGRRLEAADAMFYKAMDSGDATKMQRVGQYRQALRDVTSLPGFPCDFTWPNPPDAA